MTDTLNIGVIGLGVMGQRMLDRLKTHPRLRPTLVWDANPQALQRTLAAYPQLQAAAGPEALLAAKGLHSAYIATPPDSHVPLANAAFDAGLAVLCEKPLTMNFDEGRRTVARIASEGLRDAVNFSLASSPGLKTLEAAWAQDASVSIGDWQSVSIELSFAAWPRPWQSAAGQWLSERKEGGFTREVLSHFIFVLQRVMGPAKLVSAHASYPGGMLAETALTAQLQASGVPVHVDGALRGDVSDVNRFTVTGSKGSLQLQEWFGVSQMKLGAGDWTQLVDSAQARQQGQASQLDQWVAMIEGRPHGLPRFGEALAVQELIEALLA